MTNIDKNVCNKNWMDIWLEIRLSRDLWTVCSRHFVCEPFQRQPFKTKRNDRYLNIQNSWPFYSIQQPNRSFGNFI